MPQQIAMLRSSSNQRRRSSNCCSGAGVGLVTHSTPFAALPQWIAASRRRRDGIRDRRPGVLSDGSRFHRIRSSPDGAAGANQCVARWRPNGDHHRRDDGCGAIGRSGLHVRRSCSGRFRFSFAQSCHRSAGTVITVTASVPFSNVSWMSSPWFLGGKTLTANSQMRKEGFE